MIGVISSKQLTVSNRLLTISSLNANYYKQQEKTALKKTNNYLIKFSKKNSRLDHPKTIFRFNLFHVIIFKMHILLKKKLYKSIDKRLIIYIVIDFNSHCFILLYNMFVKLPIKNCLKKCISYAYILQKTKNKRKKTHFRFKRMCYNKNSFILKKFKMLKHC